jgi:predicted MFS family arabinose efflux permease
MKIRFTNPWWVVAGAVTGLFVCNGPVLAFTFGVFLKPIIADTGWSRGDASFVLSIGHLPGAIAVPVLGWMMDRWGIRHVALPGIVLYAACLCLLALSPHTLWICALMFAVTFTASSVQTPLGYAKAIAAWFDARRGLALGIAMSGVGLGAFVWPQAARLLIAHLGWRGAYPVLGLFTLAIASTAVALWIREPQPGEGERRSPEGDSHGLGVAEAARTPQFWLIAATFFLVAVGVQGAVAHVVPLLTDHGVPVARAAAVMGVFGLATLCGRLLAGWLLDRFFAAHVATALFLAPVAGFVLIASATGPLPALGVVTMGIGLGTEIDLIAFLTSRYFGQRAFGKIYGYFFMIFGIGSGVGPYLGGLTYDMAHSYTPALLGAGALLIAAVALVNRLGPYRYPAERAPTGALAPEAAVS